MKKIILILMSIFVIGMVSYANYIDEELEELKKEIGESEWTPEEEYKNNVRELKFPGDRYVHCFQTETSGRGKLTEKYIWWPDIEKKLNFSHKVDVTLAEEIISTQNDLENGIIKSKFRVVTFDEKFGIGKSSARFGIISSNDFFAVLEELGKLATEYDPEIKKIGKSLFSIGLGALTVPEPVISKGTAIALIASGQGIICLNKLIQWGLGEELPKHLDEDKNYILKPEDVREKMPDFEKVLCKMRNLEGIEIEATWEWDKGYTQVNVVSKSDSVTAEDERILKKIILRLNPIGVKTLLPSNYEQQKSWAILGHDLRSVFACLDIKYKKLNGAIWIINSGEILDEFKDEKKLGREKVPVLELKLNRNRTNKLNFEKENKKGELSIQCKPTVARIKVVMPEKGKNNTPMYVKEIEVQGNFENMKRNDIKDDSFLKQLSIEESSVEIISNYQQIRCAK